MQAGRRLRGSRREPVPHPRQPGHCAFRLSWQRGNFAALLEAGCDSAIPTAIRKGLPLRRLPWHSRALDQIRHLMQEVIERLGTNYRNGYTINVLHADMIGYEIVM